MSLVLIESDAALRTLLQYLAAHSHQPVIEFASAAEAFPFLHSSTVALTVLCDDSWPELLHLLNQQSFPHAHRYVHLPHTLATQLRRYQRRLDRLLDSAQQRSHSSMLSPTDVTPAQWEQIEPFLLPQQTAGRPRVNQRQTLNGILAVVRSGTAWSAMPKQYGNYVTCWRRWHQWQRDGTWQRIQDVLGQLNRNASH
jgi:transposase